MPAKGPDAGNSKQAPEKSASDVSAAEMDDLVRRQRALQAELVAQTQEAEQRQKDALERGKRDAAELQKQLDKQYAEHKKRMDDLAKPSANPPARTTGYVVDFGSIPVFSGDGEDGVTVEDFLAAVEGVVSFHDLGQKDIMGLLVAKTRRAASRFVGLLSAEEKASMKTVKKAFLKEYKINTPRSTLEAQFSDCKQRRYESVTEFYHRLLNTSHRLEVATPKPEGADATVFSAMWEDRRVSRFLAGLKPELRRALIGREPKTLQEARNMALSAEEVETSATQDQDRSVAFLYTDEGHHSRISRLQQEELALMEARVAAMRLSSAPVEGVQQRQQQRGRFWRDRPRSKSPRRAVQFHSDGARVQDTSCFLCREEGHWISECPLQMCGRCGEKGHLPRSCPADSGNPKN
jgi:hypothetical protein